LKKRLETFRTYERGDTRNMAATLVGVSGRSLEKTEAVVKAAEAKPERFGKIVAVRRVIFVGQVC